MIRKLTIAGMALLLASVLLGAIAMQGWASGIDVAIMRAVQLREGQSPELLIATTQFVSSFGEVGWRAAAVAVILAVLVALRRKRSTMVYFAAVGLSIWAHTEAKTLYARTRPHLAPWLDTPSGLSYPSGHAAGSMVVLLTAALLLGGRRSMVAAIMLSVAIGITRPLLGVHWPSDVVGGWLWGAGFAMLGGAGAMWLRSRRS